jgi:hypothetical protein
MTSHDSPCFVLATRQGRPTIWNYYPNREAAETARIRLPSDTLWGGPEDYEPLPWAEFEARQRVFYLREPQAITAEEWSTALGMLPPLRWEVADGVERFLCSEFIEANFTRQYARLGQRHVMKVVDAGDPATWLTRAMIEALPAEIPPV